MSPGDTSGSDRILGDIDSTSAGDLDQENLSQQKGHAPRRLYVGNLPFNVTEQELKDLFKPFSV